MCHQQIPQKYHHIMKCACLRRRYFPIAFLFIVIINLSFANFFSVVIFFVVFDNFGIHNVAFA